MLRASPSPAFDARLASVSGGRIPRRAFTPRSKIALSAGFLIAASAAILIGPNLGSVFAEDDGAASFWRAEAARRVAAKPAAALAGQIAPAARQTAATARQTAVRAQAYRARTQQAQKPPRQMTAYAPVEQPRLTAHAGSIWFFNRPDGLNGPSAGPNLLAPQFSGRERHTVSSAQKKRTPATYASASSDAPRTPAARMVCVRLCDGYFFPAPTGMSATDAGCAAACPNAPTRLYSMRTDRIVDAVAARDGAPYARLPVALQYTRTREQTCSCGAADPRSAIMADRTLRQGDRFMTENGFLIYQGGRSQQTAARRFATLAKARNVPAQERRLLAAMERVSVVRGAERFAATVVSGTHVALGPPERPLALR